MWLTELIIAVLLGVLGVITSIYLTYFLYGNYKKKKEAMSEDDYEESYYPKSKKNLVLSIILCVYFGFSLFSFATNLVYKSMPMINNQYYVSVNSNSMAAKHSNNSYLAYYDLNNQIAQYDIAVFDKYNGEDEIKQYDIILFKSENKLIVHRVFQINPDGTFVTRGDNNGESDENPVSKIDVLGIYNHKLVFMSFINYLGYTPGFYIALVAVTYDLGVMLVFEILDSKLKKEKEA